MKKKPSSTPKSVEFPTLKSSERCQKEEPITNDEIKKLTKNLPTLLKKAKKGNIPMPKKRPKMTETPYGSALYDQIKKDYPGITDEELEAWGGLI